MRIALLQEEAVPVSITDNLATLKRAATIASAQGSALLMTSELFVTGYTPNLIRSEIYTPDITRLKDEISAIAKSNHMAIAASYPSFSNNSDVYISAGFWDNTGDLILEYNKVHLWGTQEKDVFMPSSTAPRIVHWNGWNIAFQICFDIEFPEPARYAAGAGAQLLIVPTAISESARYVPEVLVPARASENSIYVAYCNFSQSETTEFIGQSMVAGPSGTILASASSTPKLLFADLPQLPPPTDPEADYLSERHSHLYRQWEQADHPPHTVL